MTLSRNVRTVGVGLKSYLSSGMTSTIAMTRLRVLSHVALAGVRKLVVGKPGWAAAAPTVPSIASMATTTLRVNEFLVIVLPSGDDSEICSGTSYEPLYRQILQSDAASLLQSFASGRHSPQKLG